MQVELGERKVLGIDEIRPYWRNPRRVTEDMVNQLVASIQRYGYQQPIVVDADNVIIVGHTRYAALRRMDVTRVEVVVATDLTPAQVKQYRLLDNRVAEFTSWDFDKLTGEITALDAEIVQRFFPELSGAVSAEVSEEELLEREWARVVPDVDFVCPTCFHSFTARVTREQILSGTIDSREMEVAS